jgi:hypothetical protein
MAAFVGLCSIAVGLVHNTFCFGSVPHFHLRVVGDVVGCCARPLRPRSLEGCLGRLGSSHQAGQCLFSQLLAKGS